MNTNYYHDNFIIFLLGCLILFTSNISCSVRRPEPCIKDGHIFGTSDDLIVSYDWDSCYKRGLSYLEGECFKQATMEFKSAISQRDKDQWRARSYGMHVLEQYFPHRELGISYLNQQKFNEAILELTTSINMTETSKAKYYLNKARESLLLMNNLDNESPHITISNDVIYNDTIYTNQSHFNLNGEVIDDYYVSSIIINNNPIYISLAKPQISIDVEIDLNVGINPVSIISKDLVDNESEKYFNIVLDQEGPIFIINKNIESDEFVKLNGLVFDNGGLTFLSIGDKEIVLEDNTKNKEFDITLDVNQILSLDKLLFLAKDRAGNITECNLSNNLETAIQVAENKSVINDTLALSNIEESPMIKLFDYQKRVFKPTVVVGGIIRSKAELAGIMIGNRRFFIADELSGIRDRLKRIWYGKRTAFYFTKVIEDLKEGDNEIIIEAWDSRGQRSKHSIYVEYKINEFEKIGNRWSLALIPFTIFEGENYLFSSPRAHPLEEIHDEIRYAFFNLGRFNLLERNRIDAVMNELGLKSSDIVDQTSGPALGRLLAAEVVLPGSITEIWDGYDRCLHIIARLISVETGEVLSIKDVYGAWRNIEDEKYFLNGLAQMFFEEFPILKGSVIEKKGNNILINMGSNDFLHKGMRVIFSNDTKNIDDKDKFILGEGTIIAVKPSYSYARPDNKQLFELIQSEYIVVTK